MKANELRIGNIVTIENKMYWEAMKGKPLRVIGINLGRLDKLFPKSTGRISLETFDRKLQFSQMDEFIQAIILTEEWLLKFGAILQPWGWVLNEILIRWNLKDKFWIELGNGKKIELPYVHIFQNFFALTGEELIYTK